MIIVLIYRMGFILLSTPTSRSQNVARNKKQGLLPPELSRSQHYIEKYPNEI